MEVGRRGFAERALLLAVVACALSAPAAVGEEPASPYAGEDVCTACHSEQAESYA
jgi:hypothetical protein